MTETYYIPKMRMKKGNKFIPNRWGKWANGDKEDNFNEELRIGYLYGGNQQFLKELSATLQVSLLSLFHYLKERKGYVDMQEYKDKSKAYKQAQELLEAVNKMQEEANNEWIKWSSIVVKKRWEEEPEQSSFNF